MSDPAYNYIPHAQRDSDRGNGFFTNVAMLLAWTIVIISTLIGILFIVEGVSLTNRINLPNSGIGYYAGAENIFIGVGVIVSGILVAMPIGLLGEISKKLT